MTQEAATPAGFWDKVEQIAQRAVAEYARSGALRNSRITGGNGLTIADGGALRIEYPASMGGETGIYFGDNFTADGTDTYTGTGLLVQNTDGKDIAQFRSDAATGRSIAVIRDANETSVLFTDTTTGVGLARPWFTGPFYLARDTDWPTTTATGFETLYRAKISKQNPGLEVRAWGVNNTSGGTGEIRVMVNGVQLGATATTAFGTVTERVFSGNVAGAHMSQLVIEIQARLSGGTGGVRVGASGCEGRNF